MAVYTIIRVYEVPADNRIQATERMLEALMLKTERVRDYIREPDEKPGKGKPVDLRPNRLADSHPNWVCLSARQTVSSLSTYPFISVSW